MKKKQKWPDRLWIVRHARSYAQHKREVAEKSGALSFELGLPEDQAPLVRRGKKQANARGQWFKEMPSRERPTVVLVSPYLRTRQTAAEIIAACGLSRRNVRVIVDDRLRELWHGDLNHLTRKGMQQFHPEELEKLHRLGELAYRQPNGENRWDVVKRLRPLIKDLQTVYAGQRVLIVTHSAVIRCLRYLIEQLTEEQFLEAVQGHDAANCSVRSYVRNGDKLVPARVPYLGDPLRTPWKARGSRINRRGARNRRG